MNVRNTHVARLSEMSDTAPRWTAGPLTRAALAIAAELFADKSRKVGDTPYLSHLLAVSALVMEHGGSEVQAAAGLLHDVIEDTPHDAAALTNQLLAAGVNHADAQQVAEIVKASSDGKFGEPRDKSTWRERKEEYLNRLRAKDSGDSALLVSLADKVHNSEATLVLIRGGTTATEFYVEPPFNAKAPDQKWYYTSLSSIFREKLGPDTAAEPLVTRLELAVDEIFAGVA
ncbi:MAG: HD domain-containing protein [Actinobacteria bacterium]|nr:HD domain-containing protein [Actinomycetota bacterium]